jgi:hypothetical protein
VKNHENPIQRPKLHIWSTWNNNFFLKLYVLTFVDVSEVNALLRWKYTFDNQSKATLSTWTRTINSNKIDTFKNQGIT